MQELSHTEWDLVVFTETWRQEVDEIIKTEQNHNWFGCGGTRGQNGVGFFLHSKHSYDKFVCISDRVAFLDVKLGDTRFRFIAVYMPHSGYAEQNVDFVYTQLEEIIYQSRQKNFQTILAGDFNADVGIQCDGEIFEANDRGIWLRQFCLVHSLDISNESSMASAPQRWTFKRLDCQKQLDYFLLDDKFVKNVCSCIAVDYFDTGSDHRAVE